MSTKYGRWLIVCVAMARLVLNHAGAAPVTIGIPLPQAQGVAMTESMRQSLISELKAQSIDAVPLDASTGDLNAEVQAKHYTYVLYTRLEQKHSMGSGVFSKLSLLTHGISPDAIGAGGGAASVKRGDTLTLDYRLMAAGSSDPIKADTLSAKATADGQDVVSPLVTQLSSAVAAAAQGKDRGTALAQASTQAAPTASSDTQSSSNGSKFGGFFGHRSISSTKPTGGGMGGSMDCAKLASMPNAPMSVEACEKLQGTQQAYNQAASDPSAQRPGDEQMSCAQITAELKQQQYTAQDKTKVAELGATTKEQQQIIHKEEVILAKRQAEAQTAVAAATAADTATELATGGLVSGHALNAVEKTLDAQDKVEKERVMREDLPTTQKMISQTAGLGADFGQQLQANPRLGRLMQLADSKHCKGGG
ncbi:MAG TPA: hypothetical protein VNZ02_15890 [Steroidobacteraceae bacterium]|jgi:hypothetical protein|nr:hypothetical protein [Steroidobacteraceae bacterium]